jgi:hypothetical protein
LAIQHDMDDFMKAWSERALQFAIDQKVATNSELSRRFKLTNVMRVKVYLLPFFFRHPVLLERAKKIYNKFL